MLSFIIWFVGLVIVGWLVVVVIGFFAELFVRDPKPYVSKLKDDGEDDD